MALHLSCCKGGLQARGRNLATVLPSLSKKPGSGQPPGAGQRLWGVRWEHTMWERNNESSDAISVLRIVGKLPKRPAWELTLGFLPGPIAAPEKLNTQKSLKTPLQEVRGCPQGKDLEFCLLLSLRGR